MKAAGKSVLTSLYRAFSWITGFRSPRFVFIMGHMRTGSSLLSHLLLSNAEIMGLGESNAIYSQKNDLWRLVMKAQWQQRQFSRTARYLDQINHNKKTPQAPLLQKNNVQLICLIREPAHATASIMKLTQDYYTPWTHEQAEAYLCQRYEGILQLAQSLPKERVIWVEYEKLTSQSEETLARLSDFLTLQTPLSPEYETHSFSGKHGDPSDNLKSGQINRQAIKKELPPVGTACQKAYDQCIELARLEDKSGTT